jgi:hypothetical protein
MRQWVNLVVNKWENLQISMRNPLQLCKSCHYNMQQVAGIKVTHTITQVMMVRLLPMTGPYQQHKQKLPNLLLQWHQASNLHKGEGSNTNKLSCFDKGFTWS